MHDSCGSGCALYRPVGLDTPQGIGLAFRRIAGTREEEEGRSIIPFSLPKVPAIWFLETVSSSATTTVPPDEFGFGYIVPTTKTI